MENDGVFHVNPGSCGMPLDFSCDAPYTIIEPTSDSWKITELRVEYDVEKTIDDLRTSPLYEQAEIWSRIMIQHLRTGGDYIAFFLNHALDVAKKYDENAAFPVSNEVWREAAHTFEMFDISKV